MSRPRFLADNDLTDQIVLGVQRREPSVEFTRIRDVGLAKAADSDVLEYAAREEFLVVSHDVNTMRAAAVARIEAGQDMSGLLLVHQRSPIAETIEELIVIWIASDAEEWNGEIRFLPYLRFRPRRLVFSFGGRSHSEESFRKRPTSVAPTSSAGRTNGFLAYAPSVTIHSSFPSESSVSAVINTRSKACSSLV